MVLPNGSGTRVVVFDTEDEDVQPAAIRAKTSAPAAMCSRLVKDLTSLEEPELYDRAAGF